MSFKDYYETEWMIKDSGIKDGSYDRSWRSRWEFARINIRDNTSVLDAACGDGVLGEFLIRDKNCTVYGADLSEYALKLSSAKGIIAKQCDISSDVFPFENNSIDYVTMLCCLEHIIDPVHAVSEALRVLKPGGKVIVTLPNAVFFKNRLNFFFGKVPLDLLHIKPGEGMHIQFYNYADEFEKRVLKKINNVRYCVVKKKGDVKNPQHFNKTSLFLFRGLIRLWPNMFSQYTHWVIEKQNGDL